PDPGRPMAPGDHRLRAGRDGAHRLPAAGGPGPGLRPGVYGRLASTAARRLGASSVGETRTRWRARTEPPARSRSDLSVATHRANRRRGPVVCRSPGPSAAVA